MYRFIFAGHQLCALPSGALFWPEMGLLCVSDLHLGKSERQARRGGSLLPPYETGATLERLATDLQNTNASQVICLGDSFDDLDAAQSLAAKDRNALTVLMAERNWIWIEGNHDAGALDLGGRQAGDFHLGTICFRHIATSDTHEISGHYHPKLRLSGMSMRCFLLDEARIILPAYGAYTGGLWSHDATLSDLMLADALALALGQTVLALPMPRYSKPRACNLPR